ncbi:hypothetical protein AB0C44_07755 [Micromonospora taraxaci]|uniref:hypothetical protein n=1 Tax=Micromonospora taraxaci TaxID=1316803 RepID=UPI0033DC7C36
MTDPFRHTWPHGRCPDGDSVRAQEPLPDPLPPRDLRRARLAAALVAVVVLAGVVIGALR